MRENGVFDKIKNLISVVAFVQDDNAEIEENYATGIKYLDNWLADLTNTDNYKKAEVYLLKALEVDSENYYVYPALGALYQSKWHIDWTKFEFYEKAENCYEKARMCGITDYNLTYNFGVLYLARWEHCGGEELYLYRAETMLLKSLEMNENYDMTIKVLGHIYKIMWILDRDRREYFDKATAYLEKAYEMDQNDAVACFNLGFIYQSKWNESECTDNFWLEKAEKMYFKSIQLDPSSYVAMSNLGIIYENKWLQNKQNTAYVEKAIYWYKKSFENNDTYIQAKIYLAKLYYNIWEYNGANINYLEDAEKLYAEIINIDTENAEIIFWSAIANSILWEKYSDVSKYFDRAESLYIKSIKIDNDLIDSVVNLERLYMLKITQNKNNKQDTEYFNKLINLASYVIKSDNFKLDFIIQLGKALSEIWTMDTSKTKYFVLAEKLLCKAVEIDDSNQNLDELKNLYLKKWDDSNNDSYLIKISNKYIRKISSNNKDYEAIYSLGTIYEHKWDKNKDNLILLEKTKKFYNKCLEINKYAPCYNNLGNIYNSIWCKNYEDDNFKRAEKYYLKAIAQDYLESKMNLVELYKEKFEIDGIELECFEKSIKLCESIAEIEEYRKQACIRIAEFYEQLLLEDIVDEEYINKAINHLESLFEKNNTIAELAGTIGYIYNQKNKINNTKDYETVVKWFTTAYTLNDTSWWFCNNLGRIYHQWWIDDRLNIQHIKRSKYWYEKSIKINDTPVNQMPVYNLASIADDEWRRNSYSEKLFVQAETLYKKLLEIDENNSQVIECLFDLYSDKWELDKSRDIVFEKCINMQLRLLEISNSKEFNYCNLATMYLKKWEIDGNSKYYAEQAIELLHQALKINRNFYYPYSTLAGVYFNLWQNENSNNMYMELAKQNCEKALTFDSEKSKNLIYVKLTLISFYEYENLTKDLKVFKDANRYFKNSLKDLNLNVGYDDDYMDNKYYIKEAENFFSKVVYEDDENIEAINTLADIYSIYDMRMIGNVVLFEKAEKLYLRSIALREDTKVMVKLALLYANKYQYNRVLVVYYEKAKNLYLRANELEPENKEIKLGYEKLVNNVLKYK